MRGQKRVRAVLDACLQEADPEQRSKKLRLAFESLQGAEVVREQLLAVGKELENKHERIAVDELLALCETVCSSTIFEGQGWLFDFYFLSLAPVSLYDEVLSAWFDPARRTQSLQKAKQSLRVRFHFWLISAIHGLSQKKATRQLFYLTVPADFKGLSGEGSGNVRCYATKCQETHICHCGYFSVRGRAFLGSGGSVLKKSTYLMLREEEVSTGNGHSVFVSTHRICQCMLWCQTTVGQGNCTVMIAPGLELSQ
jgi:hypothetical protein